MYCCVLCVIIIDVLRNAAANNDSAQPESDNSAQQNQPPAEKTSAPRVPENNAGSFRLQPEQVPHQQPVAAFQEPPHPPAVCIVLMSLWNSLQVVD